MTIGTKAEERNSMGRCYFAYARNDGTVAIRERPIKVCEKKVLVFDSLGDKFHQRFNKEELAYTPKEAVQRALAIVEQKYRKARAEVDELLQQSTALQHWLTEVNKGGEPLATDNIY